MAATTASKDFLGRALVTPGTTAKDFLGRAVTDPADDPDVSDGDERDFLGRSLVA